MQRLDNISQYILNKKEDQFKFIYALKAYALALEVQEYIKLGGKIDLEEMLGKGDTTLTKKAVDLDKEEHHLYIDLDN